MCGIVGAAARRNIIPVVIEGLRRLEHRACESRALARPATSPESLTE
jgi:glucosamine--fructose-6-phosphate aminotransferase (isomerizing)